MAQLSSTGRRRSAERQDRCHRVAQAPVAGLPRHTADCLRAYRAARVEAVNAAIRAIASRIFANGCR